MSLKLINQSSNRKTGGIATTYRADSSMYGSCPASCSLNPDGDNSATEIDQDYLTALRKAVPKKGQAWTYSHFDYTTIPQNEEKHTTINYSADTVIQALNSFNSGRETTYTAPSTMTDKVDNIQGGRKYILDLSRDLFLKSKWRQCQRERNRSRVFVSVKKCSSKKRSSVDV